MGQISKLELVGSKEMKISAITCLTALLQYSGASKLIKRFMNATTLDKEMEAIQFLDSAIWTDFVKLGYKYGKQFRRPDSQRVRLCGTIPQGYRIVFPYNPKEPKAVSVEVWRNKEVLTVHADQDEELRIFGRILYKLGGYPEVWKEPVEINGEVLRLGHWMAAFICKGMGDEAGYSMYHDEGLEVV